MRKLLIRNGYTCQIPAVVDPPCGGASWSPGGRFRTRGCSRLSSMTSMKSPKAMWFGIAALAPYILMKTYWAFGGNAGRPAGDLGAGMRANGAPEALVWMEQHGVDFTVLGALGGVLLLMALARPWGERLPRWALPVPGWMGALALTPYGFATLIASAVGFTVGDAEGWSPWVGYVGGLAFAGLGLSLAICTRSYQRRTRPSAVLARS
ncbi:hypothetical protein J2S55_005711 [Streptosporangium brasiliense]|uniref:DUF3995 domain-containing protein n=2 Tax=Streptosporangiaceae TaxID=2004 RepID=A0ABT9RB13_9ACTN|nr:hypothetical protein [Streptosporangium brasiliense]MDP9866445.1 hypothetical protein [Streptosporangium brasiliense]